MNRTPLVAIIIVIAALTAVLDFFTAAKLMAAVLYILPLILSITQRSKWLLWTTATSAVLLSVAAGIWGLHRVASLDPWVPSANRGLFIASLLTLAALIHLSISKSQRAALGAAKMERYSNGLIARNEQLHNELAKLKGINRGKRKALVLTIKQYQAFSGQLSDLHRTMVVAAMCTGMRVSEVLALRWDQLDFATGLMTVQPGAVNGGVIKTEGAEGQLPMDPVLVKALLEWRNKTSGTGLLFPSHITGRCYHAGPIQQDYFRPVARKLGLVGVCWHTFPNSYKSWLEENATAASVQQRLMRHAPASAVINQHARGSLKPKGKTNGKVGRQALPTVGLHLGSSTDRPSLIGTGAGEPPREHSNHDREVRGGNPYRPV
jgi:integrase